MDYKNASNVSRPIGEYRQILVTPVDKLMQAIADEAQNGWELVCVTVEEPYDRAFLKRPKGSNDSQ